MQNFQAMIAGLQRAHFDRKPAMIGGGEFSPDECKTAADALSAAPALLAALQGLLRYCVTPAGMPDKGKGRTDEQQAAYDAARAVIAAATGTPTDGTEAPAPTAQTYTAFCQESDGTGTIWIDTVEAESVEDAKERAIAKCSFDWNFDPLSIHCLGIAAGDCKIHFWKDVEG